MKYLNFFESHSSIESLKSEILNLGIKKLAYDIIDASLDNLDEYERDKEGEIMKKSLIFDIYIDGAYFIPIINCEFNLNDNFSEKDINWISYKEEELLLLKKELNKPNCKINVTLSIIAGEEGDKRQLKCVDILEKLEGLYPPTVWPNIEFDTFDPWDIN